MTIQFIGTLRYRLRLSIFGYDLFAGPWQSQNVKWSAPIPAESASIPIADGFTADVSEAGNGVSLAFHWEGVQLASETVPLTGSLPISLQPLKGVILAGTASISS